MLATGFILDDMTRYDTAVGKLARWRAACLVLLWSREEDREGACIVIS